MRVDVRIIAATSRDLHALVREAVPRRPLLPLERGADHPAAAARPAGGHREHRRPHPGTVGDPAGHPAARAAGIGGAGAARL
ncbi:hypothetical protein [Azospirillum sp. B2RO_4]|uniref:hypothetical protein n=1 Tax=Azospirillum sp. B2RO_4 TaxID=3027796 RepID=UPI003DA88C0A